MTSAIIVASGASQRMGFDKLTAELSGQSVLRRSINAFLAAKSINSIVVVCPEERWASLGEVDGKKPIIRVDGGDTRQASVHAGINALPAGTIQVAIHDGARPLVSPADIDRCVASAREHGAASLARRATDTMMRSDENDFSTTTVDREQLWRMETPQVFQIEHLRIAALHADDHGINCTDEVSAMQAIGRPVKLVEPIHPNLKVTTPADLTLAEAILKHS